MQQWGIGSSFLCNARAWTLKISITFWTGRKLRLTTEEHGPYPTNSAGNVSLHLTAYNSQRVTSHTSLYLAGDASLHVTGDASLHLAGNALLHVTSDASLYLASDAAARAGVEPFQLVRLKPGPGARGDQHGNVAQLHSAAVVAERILRMPRNGTSFVA